MKLGILTDLHEDLDSLRIAMDIFSKNKCEELVCLGDILGYDSNFYQKVNNRNASECIEIIKSNFKYIVIGNHDLYALRKIPKQHNGFIFPDNWYKLSISVRRELSENKIWLYENEELVRQLSENEEVFLNNLPEYQIAEFSNFKILFSHSIFPDITGSNFFRLHNPWELQSHFSFMQNNTMSYGFSGHNHPRNLTIANQSKIKHLPYKKIKIDQALSQYLCPCTAHGRGKSGVVIVDFHNQEIEAIEINNKFKNKMISLYGKIEKKYKP